MHLARHLSKRGQTSDLLPVAERLPPGKTRWLYERFRGPLEKHLGIHFLRGSYEETRQLPDTLDFLEKALRVLQVTYSVEAKALARIPTTGPLLVVANHPFGAIEGILLGALLTSARADAKLLGNGLLEILEPMKEHVIAVDPFGGAESTRRNLAGMREALGWLRAGHCLGVFPAGEVAHFDWKERQVLDPPWNPHVARLARKTGAQVLPVFFPGQNSPLFQVAGTLHPRLRTALLPRELARTCEHDFPVHIGTPIAAERLADFGNDAEATDYLRLRVEILRKEKVASGRKLTFPAILRPFNRAVRKEPWPLAEAVSRTALAAEIDSLPAEKLLLQHKQFRVYLATATDLPVALPEIGRLRELTFRTVQEGTGEARDLDRFDETYRHLFVWDESAREIVGAYRLGLSGEILPRDGRHGFYTQTLFRLKPAFFAEIAPAIELGRSFIVPAYQRRHAILALLWKGIGAFVVRERQYRRLFGPVSIDKAYQTLSKDLIVRFLSSLRGDDALSRLVKPRRPHKGGPLRSLEKEAPGTLLHDFDEVSALVSEIEQGRGAPILLRHYLKLNARVLAFNVDPAFNNALDGLMVTDLAKVDARLLRHFMGAEGLARFRAEHGF